MMKLMSVTSLVPVEEYLRSSEKPNAEYRDGVMTPKAMPTKLHSLIQGMLLMLLHRQGVTPLPELTVRLSPNRYLVPDVTVSDDFPGPYPTEPVLLCCEILSPDDRLSTMLSNCEEYHAWGVPYCWVIDPVKRVAWEYHASGELNRAGTALEAGHLLVNLDELFSALPHSEEG